MRNLDTYRDFAEAVALVMLVGAALAGCSHNNTSPPQPAATTTVNSAPATPPAPTTTANAPATNNVNAGPGGANGTNSGVADAVDKAIHTNVQMTGSRITAVVDSAGVATLAGSAQDQQQRALAVRAATDTPGVTAVKDKIEIAPTGGAKSSQVTTRVIHETKVIVLPNQPANPQGGGSGNGTGTGTQSGTTNTAGNGAQEPAENGSTGQPTNSGGQ